MKGRKDEGKSKGCEGEEGERDEEEERVNEEKIIIGKTQNVRKKEKMKRTKNFKE